MRKRGFEPLRSCERQPLKLVRLPFRHFRKKAIPRIEPTYQLIGHLGVVGAGVDAGAGDAGAAPGDAGRGADPVGAGFGMLSGLGGADPLMIDPGPRWPMMASASALIMNNAARTAVAFDSTVAPARAPNADWLLPPPKAAAMSPLPCCSRITSNSSVQTST